ncbi:MAG: urate hydroxylase PuuD [Pelagibacteraceae bacterium]|nr:urate hydroxylase PuuD [Pelagibacteraceae bacterium]HJL58048.1 urate hydroxylase PuuD [Alphaproteobacteria bacterium]MBO6466050.1 urate hydroxylase PuuD [Pelagibacteraceae bacterium]MBO6468303.1 urate hydroxylase PuuD [Pelagibacteraceae bacterium]MBO6470169.1 urate hydroxylase PuuD [Pelagibacteraceae bacterium]
MSNILQSLNRTVVAGIILTIVLFIIMYSLSGGWHLDAYFWSAIFRYLHVLSGIMWIGLLYYFNFVQIPNMPNIPDEQKPAIGKVIAPAALFWFRWAALSTIITGLIVAYLNGYVNQAMSLGLLGGDAKNITIGIGMWLGIIMAYNVWMVIWPNQKKALGMIEVSAEEKAKSAKTAMLFSRTNTLLSIPMLLSMVSAQNLF